MTREELIEAGYKSQGWRCPNGWKCWQRVTGPSRMTRQEYEEDIQQHHEIFALVEKMPVTEEHIEQRLRAADAIRPLPERET